LKIPVEIKDDLFNADFRKSLNCLIYKRPSSEYNLNPLKKRSLRKCPKSNSYGEHLEKPKDGRTCDATEGEPSHVEANPIFSPSMPTTDISFEPILNFNDLSMHFLLSLMMILEID
jgi:hypothetical protein